MTDHLPECLLAEAIMRGDQVLPACICERLRACEQRIRIEQAMSNQPTFDWLRGRAAGLDAAREAIFEIPHFGDFVDTADAFAAIDALRGEK